MENAAYEGARKGITPGATAQECEAMARAVLGTIGVDDASVQVTPLAIEPDTPRVTVTITVEADQYGFGTAIFLQDRVLRRSCTLTREQQQ